MPMSDKSMRIVTSAVVLGGALLAACAGAASEGGTGSPSGQGEDAGAAPLGDDGGGSFLGSDATTRLDATCGEVRVESKPLPAAVDVVWVIDDSPSMAPQVLPVGDNMARFMDGVRTSGGDISVVMVTGPIIGTALSAAITDANYHWVPEPVESHDAFDWALASYDAYSQYLRSGAALHFVFVSDDFSVMSGNDFVARMTTTHGGPFTVHAVAADGVSGPCLGFPPFVGGGEYYAAAAATGGEHLSLCGDWGSGFDVLEKNVEASLPLPCAYDIPKPPNGEVLDPQAVQVLFTANGGAPAEFARAEGAAQCADQLAFRFDEPSAPSSVLLCPAACEAVRKGGTIQLGFGCAPSVILR
jgi:hypothetical protein